MCNWPYGFSMNNPNELDPYLRTIEYEYGIKIIGAWDRGSRAWGLHTSNSDYDIRICFTQPYTDYIMGSEYLESIQSNGEQLNKHDFESPISPSKIEFQGWDIKRFIELLSNNNPSIFECLASPLTYQSHPIFNDIADYSLERIHPIELWNHYQSAAKKNYLDYLENEKDASAKRTLFIFRNILCGEYIRYTHEFPIINYQKLLENAPEECFQFIDKCDHERLMNLKKNSDKDKELGNTFENEIEAYIHEEMDYQKHIPDETIQVSELDSFIEKLIRSTTMFM